MSQAFPFTAILSDVHSNWPALSCAVSDAAARGARRFACLGDVIGYGARPQRCLDEIMRLCGPAAVEAGFEPGFCLQGNHEQALLNSAEDFNPNARRAIEWTRDELWRAERAKAGVWWACLAGLEPLHAEQGALYAHGSPRDPVREYLLPRDARDGEKMAANFRAMAPFDALKARVCFVGHSHVPGVFYQDGRYFRPKGSEGPFDLGDLSQAKAIVNVGSVGQPRDGDPRLSYALFDGRNISFVRLEYDVRRAQADILEQGELPEYLAQRLAAGQ